MKNFSDGSEARSKINSSVTFSDGETGTLIWPRGTPSVGVRRLMMFCAKAGSMKRMFWIGVVNTGPAVGTLTSMALTGWATTAASTAGSTRLAATAVKVGWATRVATGWNTAVEENLVNISTSYQL